jgi:hypothetical protein
MNQKPFGNGLVLSQAHLNDHDLLALLIGNQPLGNAGIAQGATTTSLKVTNAVTYRCGGQLYTTTSAAQVAFPVTGNAQFTGLWDITPNATTVQERVYAVTITSAGTLGMISTFQTTDSEGVQYPLSTLNVANTSALQFTGSGQAPYPELPSNGGLPINGITVLGGVRIAVAAGSIGFEANVTNVATSGAITVTFFQGYPVPLFAAGALANGAQ